MPGMLLKEMDGSLCGASVYSVQCRGGGGVLNLNSRVELKVEGFCKGIECTRMLMTSGISGVMNRGRIWADRRVKRS